MHILTQDTVRTDKDTHFSFFKSFKYRLGLCSSTGTAQVLHFTGESFQSFAKGLKVLISQHGSRYQYCHLFIIGHCLKGSTDSHFCLSKPHITTNKAIHRAVTFHICLHLGSSLTLVGRIFINKRSLQLTLQKAIGTIGKSLFFTAL